MEILDQIRDIRSRSEGRAGWRFKKEGKGKAGRNGLLEGGMMMGMADDGEWD